MANTRPNVLLLFSDQHSARVLGCYGDQQAVTPNLDRLADEGVRFENAYAQNPICTPSRMCYMSGQYVHNFGHYALMGPCPTQLPNAFAWFRRHGYRTGMAGKIHTPTGWLAKDCDFVADGYGHETAVKPWNANILEGNQGTSCDEYYDYLRAKGLESQRDDKFLKGYIERAGTRSVWYQGLDACPSQLGEDDTIEAWTAARTNDFIRQCHRDDAPFFFWMTVPRPHETYVPARKFWDLYDERTLQLPPNANDPLEGRHPETRRQAREWRETTDWLEYEPKDWESARRRILRGYYGCVSQVDDAVGRVLRTLEELGLRENTIVVYATDHGEFAGEHGLIEKVGGIAFRCCTRIPWIWSWPGHLPEGAVREELAETVDFLPTAAALAGLPAPDWVDGRDISTMLARGGEVRDIAVTESAFIKTAHTRRWRYVHYPPEQWNGEEAGELYDCAADPWEMRNLFHDPAHRAVVEDLRARLLNWLIRTTRHVTCGAPTRRDGQKLLWDNAENVAEDGKVRKG